MGTSRSEPPPTAGEARPSDDDLALIAAAIAAHEARRPAPLPESAWRHAGRREGLRG